MEAPCERRSPHLHAYHRQRRVSAVLVGRVLVLVLEDQVAPTFLEMRLVNRYALPAREDQRCRELTLLPLLEMLTVERYVGSRGRSHLQEMARCVGLEVLLD